MKQYTLLVLICLMNISGLSQGERDKKVWFGILAGTNGFYLMNETRLLKDLSIRIDLGLNVGRWRTSFPGIGSSVLVPEMAIEPCWNIMARRLSPGGKVIDLSWYVSCRAGFHPAWFVISPYDYIKIVPDMSVVPGTGFRSVFWRHLLVEAGIGLRYTSYFGKSAGFSDNMSSISFTYHVGAGFVF